MDIDLTGASAESAPVRSPTEQQPGSAWGSWLSQPANRAFLIQAGVNLMTGGWGNAGQQLGAALGAGAQASTETDNVQRQTDALARQEDFRERELTQRRDIAGEDRAGRENVARIGAESRTDVAHIRAEAALQRAMTQAGVRAGTADDQIFRQMFTTSLRTLRETNLTRAGGALTEDQIIAQAEADATRAFRAQQGVRSPPASGAPTSTPGTTTGDTTGSLGTTGPAPRMQAQGTLTDEQADAFSAPGGKGTVQEIPGGGAINRPQPMGFEQWVQANQQHLATPEARARFRQQAQGRATTLQYLDRYEQMQGQR